MTLTEFLLARIAEDEAVARAAIDDDGGEDGGFENSADLLTWQMHDPQPNRFGAAAARLISHTAVPRRVLAECEAKRRIVDLEAVDLVLADWMPDCGGDWCLSGGSPSDEPGTGYFANYWPDNTVSVSIYVDGDDVADSGIVKRKSRADCMAFAEQFVRDNLPNVSPILRSLAAVYSDHPDYDEAWRP